MNNKKYTEKLWKCYQNGIKENGLPEKELFVALIDDLIKQIEEHYKNQLAGIIGSLEYAAYNLFDGKKYTDLSKGIESTGAGDSLLMAIRDLKELTS